jgi:hypothetical protein
MIAVYPHLKFVFNFRNDDMSALFESNLIDKQQKKMYIRMFDVGLCIIERHASTREELIGLSPFVASRQLKDHRGCLQPSGPRHDMAGVSHWSGSLKPIAHIRISSMDSLA